MEADHVVSNCAYIFHGHTQKRDLFFLRSSEITIAGVLISTELLQTSHIKSCSHHSHSILKKYCEQGKKDLL